MNRFVTVIVLAAICALGAIAAGVVPIGSLAGGLSTSIGTTPASCEGDCVPRAELTAALKLSNKRLRHARRWALIAYHYRLALRHRPSTVEAIKLAAVAYGVDVGWMLRRGSCESTGGHGHNPNATNPSSGAAGEFQFLLSTWRTTPFRSFSRFSPYANALAAGWMMGPAGRANEWVCR